MVSWKRVVVNGRNEHAWLWKGYSVVLGRVVTDEEILTYYAAPALKEGENKKGFILFVVRERRAYNENDVVYQVLGNAFQWESEYYHDETEIPDNVKADLRSLVDRCSGYFDEHDDGIVVIMARYEKLISKAGGRYYLAAAFRNGTPGFAALLRNGDSFVFRAVAWTGIDGTTYTNSKFTRVKAVLNRLCEEAERKQQLATSYELHWENWVDG